MEQHCIFMVSFCNNELLDLWTQIKKSVPSYTLPSTNIDLISTDTPAEYYTNVQWVYVVYGEMYTGECHVPRGSR